MNSQPKPLAYLERAIRAIEPLASVLPAPLPPQSLADVSIEDLRQIDPENTILVARTLQYSHLFSDLIRSAVADVEIASRYEKITSLFDSIQEDAKKLVGQLEDGGLDWKERLLNRIHTFLKGSIDARFGEISKIFVQVTTGTRDQLEREDKILSAYLDFRSALKEAQIAAERIRVRQEARLALLLQTLDEARAKADSAPEGEAKFQAQLERDQALREVQKAESLYFAAEQLAQKLLLSYQASELIMEKLRQTHEAKRAVFTKAVAFFSTSEHVVTALSAAFTSQAGLHEAAKTTEMLSRGIDKSLETLADIGTEVNKDALRIAYGPTISVDSVKKLANAIIDYQSESRSLIAKYRAESQSAAEEIQKTVEDAKQQSQALASST